MHWSRRYAPYLRNLACETIGGPEGAAMSEELEH